MDEFDRLLNEYSIACAAEGAAAAHSRDSDMLDEQVEPEAALRAHVAALRERAEKAEDRAAGQTKCAAKAVAKLTRVRECVAFPVDDYRLAVAEVRDVLGDGGDE